MNILIIGDVVGSPGRAIMKKALPVVFARHDIDYCIANVENAAGGFGVTKEVCDEFLDLGVDCMTSGNHIWDKREIIGVVDLIPQLLRPANYPERQPGRGTLRRPRQGLGGAGGHPQPERPRLHERRHGRSLRARPARRWSGCARRRAVIIVDMHAEATSEKHGPRRTTWTARSRRWWARTPTSPPATTACCPRAPPTAPTSA